jgi:SAM-dependent methyltransferase
MPTLAENRNAWDASYDWGCAGDEWSEAWSTPQAQWAGCLYPRIFPFLKGRILEIAPGHGRWTQFLRDHCTSLIGVDLAATCVSECRSKFKSDPRLNFEVGDGRKLPMVADASIDFAFSFDSLVHAEADILESYASELARVLKPSAIAFLHHSNLATLTERSVWEKLKRRWAGIPINPSWRAYSMSAKAMRESLSALACLASSRSSSRGVPLPRFLGLHEHNHQRAEPTMRRHRKQTFHGRGSYDQAHIRACKTA